MAAWTDLFACLCSSLLSEQHCEVSWSKTVVLMAEIHSEMLSL